LDLLKQTIRPEFLNRVDDIIMFKPLTREEIETVVRLQMHLVVKLMKANGIDVEVADQTIRWLAEAGFDPQYGARPVKRIIQKHVLNELSRKIISGAIDKERKVIVEIENKQLVFKN
jgi:ATP-dependent Clp protease ATP-binding subunit ClpB